MNSTKIPRHEFCLSRVYGKEFEGAIAAFYKASRLLFADLSKLDDIGALNFVNQIFYDSIHAELNWNFDPHLSGGLFATLLTKPKEGRSFLYRPTLILKRLVARAVLLELEIGKNRSRLKAARKKLGVQDGPIELTFSPLFFVRQFFTDPDYLASDAYIHSLIRAEVFRSALRFASEHPSPDEPPAVRTGHPFERIRWYIKFERVAASLQKIALHRRGRDNIDPVDATDFIVMHLLASRGHMALRFGAVADSKNLALKRRPDYEPQRMSRNAFLDNADLIPPPHSYYEFKVLPEVKELPTAAELANELDGLPIPVPGIDTVLFGGLRFTEDNGVVMRISGKTGTGKTSLALGVALALAPLGTRTVYLSCEEQPVDLVHRIQTLVPPHVRRLEAFQSIEHDWFSAEHLSGGPAERFRKVESFLDYVQKKTHDLGGNKLATPPGAVRLLIVIDGVHEILGEGVVSSDIDPSHRLVERCRDTGSCILVLSAKTEEKLPDELDYLVDFVGGVDFAPVQSPWEQPVRTFTLRKTRRQVSRVGTHVLHISGRQGLRISPHVAAQLDQRRHIKWVHPLSSMAFDFLQNPKSSPGNFIAPIQIFDRSQILITGEGSGAKSAFGLKLLTSHLIPRDEDTGRLLSRRASARAEQEMQASFFANARDDDNDEDEDDRPQGPADEDPDVTSTWFQSTLPKRRRILILSFLYQEDYYLRTWKRIRKHRREDVRFPDSLPRVDFDVHSFTPGYLRPEDFLRITGKLLDKQELEGWPYDGVLIDGLHNVYLQFPYLEQNEMVWPMLYELLRTRGLTVVTTHTHFTIESNIDGQNLSSDLDSARRRVAPLLHALVQATDFSIRVSPEGSTRAAQLRGNYPGQKFDTRIDVIGALGQSVRPTDLYWDRDKGVVYAPGRSLAGKRA
jgi:KaiC/GvpD/RAD55 family RecA-like ATPase